MSLQVLLGLQVEAGTLRDSPGSGFITQESHSTELQLKTWETAAQPRGAVVMEHAHCNGRKQVEMLHFAAEWMKVQKCTETFSFNL